MIIISCSQAKTVYTYCNTCSKAYLVWNDGHPTHSGECLDFPGIEVIERFLSEQEEKLLLEKIDNTFWMNSQSGRRKQVQLVLFVHYSNDLMSRFMLTFLYPLNCVIKLIHIGARSIILLSYQTFQTEYFSTNMLLSISLIFSLPLLLYNIGYCNTWNFHLNGHTGRKVK